MFYKYSNLFKGTDDELKLNVLVTILSLQHIHIIVASENHNFFLQWY